MKITYDGRDYQFDFADVTTKQLKVIQAAKGMSLATLEEKVSALDLDALEGLWWLILTQNGVHVDPDEVDVKPVRLGEAFLAAQKAEKPARGKAPAARPQSSDS